MQKMKFGTLCVHLGNIRTQLPARIRHQIYQTSAFVFDNAEEGAARFAGEEEGYTYARLVPNTPTHRVLVDKMAALEGGEAGQTFSSGMAAITRWRFPCSAAAIICCRPTWCMAAPTACFHRS